MSNLLCFAEEGEITGQWWLTDACNNPFGSVWQYLKFNSTVTDCVRFTRKFCITLRESLLAGLRWQPHSRTSGVLGTLVPFLWFAVSRFTDWQDLEPHLIPIGCWCACGMHLHAKLNTDGYDFFETKNWIYSLRWIPTRTLLASNFFDLRFDALLCSDEIILWKFCQILPPLRTLRSSGTAPHCSATAICRARHDPTWTDLEHLGFWMETPSCLFVVIKKLGHEFL